MAQPPPVPAASQPVPPPLSKIQFVDLRSGLLTIAAVSFLTEFWALVSGDNGIIDDITALKAAVVAINVHLALIDGEIVVIDGRLDTIDAEIVAVDAHLTVIDGQITAINIHLATIDGQITTINTHLGVIDAEITAIDAQLTIIFGMHGDGVLAGDGTLTVTKTNGVAFGYFATGTDASHLTGTLAAARIANNSLPYAVLVNTSGAKLLGAAAAGAVAEIGLGAGLSFSGTDIVVTPTPGVLVAALGAATAGLRNFVTDSTVVAAGNFGNVVVGLGANFAPVYADGVAWRIG